MNQRAFGGIRQLEKVYWLTCTYDKNRNQKLNRNCIFNSNKKFMDLASVSHSILIFWDRMHIYYAW